jgi:ribonuclease VapC
VIVVDSSSILAILLEEDDKELFLGAILRADKAFVSVASVLECSMKLQRRRGIGSDIELDNFLDASRCRACEVDFEQITTARAAFGRYGKGMGHPAKLNFGDCFAYALAKTRNLPLLFKGNDFSQTDIVSALSN